MPQEIEVWYLIPALRKEIAKILINKKKMKQKDVALILGVTEAAISQYISSKRANEIKFPKEDLVLIEETSNIIFLDRNNSMEHLSNLSKKLMGSKTICDLHRRYDPSIKKKCDACRNL